MKEITKKNYLILAVLLISTVLLTFLLSSLYLNQEKMVSNFYQYSNKITVEDFEQYMAENSDMIIYISDKYDLTYEKFEKNFQNRIEELNLKHNLIYLDKETINKEFLENLKKTYNIDINIKKSPIVIVIVDKEIIKNVSVMPDSNANIIIDYEVFQ